MAPKGYVSLVNHALAESEVGVWEVGQRLQQNLRGHLSLEVRRVELVPAKISQSTAIFFCGLEWKLVFVP